MLHDFTFNIDIIQYINATDVYSSCNGEADYIYEMESFTRKFFQSIDFDVRSSDIIKKKMEDVGYGLNENHRSNGKVRYILKDTEIL